MIWKVRPINDDWCVLDCNGAIVARCSTRADAEQIEREHDAAREIERAAEEARRELKGSLRSAAGAARRRRTMAGGFRERARDLHRDADELDALAQSLDPEPPER